MRICTTLLILILGLALAVTAKAASFCTMTFDTRASLEELPYDRHCLSFVEMPLQYTEHCDGGTWHVRIGERTPKYLHGHLAWTDQSINCINTSQVPVCYGRRHPNGICVVPNHNLEPRKFNSMGGFAGPQWNTVQVFGINTTYWFWSLQVFDRNPPEIWLLKQDGSWDIYPPLTPGWWGFPAGWGTIDTIITTTPSLGPVSIDNITIRRP